MFLTAKKQAPKKKDSSRSILKMDPSRTLSIRKSFAADMQRRFSEVRRVIAEFLVTKDALGLEEPNRIVVANVEKREFEFRTDTEKVGEFRKWLKSQVDSKILTPLDSGKPWLSRYIESSYKKGKMRAYREAYGSLVDTPEGLKMTNDGKLLGLSFAGPEEVKRIEAIYTRAWNDLQGVTDTMAQKLSRNLSLGLAQGQNPRAIARAMTKDIDSLSKSRAVLIARTEVIASHAEGQLDGYQELGVDGVTTEAEWSTAGDDLVCEECEEYEGEIMSIKEARGLIPLHPNCRCAWIPVIDNKAKKKVDLLKKKLTAPAKPVLEGPIEGPSIEKVPTEELGSIPSTLMYRGVSKEGIEGLRSTEGVHGEGVYFYDNPLDARAYAGMGGGVIVGTASGSSIQRFGSVILLKNPTDFSRIGFIPVDRTIDRGDYDLALKDLFKIKDTSIEGKEPVVETPLAEPKKEVFEAKEILQEDFEEKSLSELGLKRSEEDSSGQRSINSALANDFFDYNEIGVRVRKLVLADSEGSIVGAASFAEHEEDPEYLHLHNLGSIKKGSGTALMKQVLAESQKLGKGLKLQPTRTSRSFYEHLGIKTWDEEAGDLTVEPEEVGKILKDLRTKGLGVESPPGSPSPKEWDEAFDKMANRIDFSDIEEVEKTGRKRKLKDVTTTFLTKVSGNTIKDKLKNYKKVHDLTRVFDRDWKAGVPLRFAKEIKSLKKELDDAHKQWAELELKIERENRDITLEEAEFFDNRTAKHIRLGQLESEGKKLLAEEGRKKLTNLIQKGKPVNDISWSMSPLEVGSVLPHEAEAASDRIREGVDFLRGITHIEGTNTGNASLRPTVILNGVGGEEGRAFYASNRLFPETDSLKSLKGNIPNQSNPYGIVYLSKNENVKTIVHEFGHGIEEVQQGAHEAIEEFLKHRCGSEIPQKMSEKFPDYGYQDWELGRVDKFDKLFPELASAYYVGKVYPEHMRSSEVLSMGLQALYDNPVRFASVDPEFFKLVVGILTGAIL